MSNAQKEYIVTVKNHNDLDQFYIDMEEENNLPHLPSRSVTCVFKRPLSRNTHYLLTDDEAKNLRKDSRILAVNIKVKNLEVANHSDQTSNWNRGTGVSTGQSNYALYRCRLENNLSGWGSDLGTTTQNSTIKITSTGKNVDIIVLDETLYPNHYEYNGRFVNYDWFDNHDIAVRGTATDITFVSRNSNSATITTQTAHGLNVGSIINVICTSDASFNSVEAEVTATPTTTTFRYVNTGSNVSSTAATGYWKGVYQYGSYDYDNNHATHVAGIISGQTQGWAREANIYNLRHNNSVTFAGSYCPPELLIDYVRQFHATKPVNPQTGRKNPTLVNCSWGFSKNVANLNNPYTGFQYPRFSRLNYRGSLISPAASAVDTGFSGIYTSTQKVSDFSNTQPSSGNRIVTDPDTVSGDPTFGTVSSITFVDTDKVGLTNIGAPTSFDDEGIDSQDDAYWNIPLPFPVKYLTQEYNNIYVNSNSYITFGGGNFTYVMGLQAPALRKICVSAGDRNCDGVYTGTFGTSGTRTFTVRWEGYDGAYGGVYETSPTLIWEATFYEAIPERIDVHVITNSCYRSEFTTSELNSYGLNLNAGTTPIRQNSIDVDIQDAIDEGIIFIGSSGNDSTKIDVPGGLDYDNYYVDNGEPIYYHRGPTPGAAVGVICVGNADSTSQENKSENSNTGPRVDLYAPGNNIFSSVYDSTAYGTSVGGIELTIEGGFAGAGSVLAQAGRAAVVTVEAHELTNGDIITIENCSNSEYNVTNVVISVVDSNTVSFDISNTSYSSGLELLTGTLKANGTYQKASGSSMSAAQITGLVALALESYPWMTQTDALNYVTSYAKLNKMFNSGGGYQDSASLQDGNNKFAYYNRERPDDGILLPKSRQWIRPLTGILFPRAQIKKN